MVLRYLPKFSSTSLEALLVEESIFRKKRHKKSIFYVYGTTFRKMEFIPVQIYSIANALISSSDFF
jgi:hypothetical protein